jgi:hypothetical protein
LPSKNEKEKQLLHKKQLSSYKNTQQQSIAQITERAKQESFLYSQSQEMLQSNQSRKAASYAAMPDYFLNLEPGQTTVLSPPLFQNNSNGLYSIQRNGGFK